MYCDKDPPKERERGEFPSFDHWTVSVEQCWHYLSLLERFVDITKAMTETDLKMYLVRAEYRYFQFISRKVPNRKISSSTPPIDIAFFWQAHMLSPVRFYEDTLRVPPFYEREIPLKAIHQTYKKKGKTISMIEWKRCMGEEPYDLTLEALHDKKSYAYVTCIVCFSRIQSPWSEYTEWRMDHSIALLCHCCYAMFTVKHVGKANLHADNTNKRNIISGLQLNLQAEALNNNKAHKLLLPIEDIRFLPFNRGLKPLDDYMKKKQSSPTVTSDINTRKNVISAIQSTYLCTPYRGSSLDLIQAVARQYKFAVKVTKNINWNAPDGIIHGIRNYSKFLAIIKENPKLQAVPTVEIDLAWHTHMLHHKTYRSFCFDYIGRIINHDDTIPETELAASVLKTDRAWKARNRKRRCAINEMKNKTLLANASSIAKKDPSSNSEENHRTKGLKNRLKSIFVSKTNKKKLTFESQLMPPQPLIDVPEMENVELQSNGYTPEHQLFGDRYFQGKYKNVPVNILDMNNCNTENTFEKTEYDLNAFGGCNKEEEEEPFFDKQKISYHAKRFIKDFIKLKNDSKLIDDLFYRVKDSGYGFIGTSTCSNTDYLDQWAHLQQDSDNDGNNDEIDGLQNTKNNDESSANNNVISPTSKYSKVFLTQASASKFNSDGVLKLSIVKKSKNKNKRTSYYSSFSKIQDERCNNSTTSNSNNFDWQTISAIWYEANNSSCKHDNNFDLSCGGGWSNCAGKNGAGITAPRGAKASTLLTGGYLSTSDESASYKVYSGCRDSCSSGGTSSSNCGGTSSSCGGQSSSCAAGSSNCGSTSF